MAAASQDEGQIAPVLSLKGKSSAEQQNLIIEDMLNAFMGLGTEYLALKSLSGPAGNPHIVYGLSEEHCQWLSTSFCEQIRKC
jgi:hypothetical protein